MLEPRWYQDQSVNAIYDYFARGNTGNPLVALPTGTGKSLVQALLLQRILRVWPRQRFICLTHVQELIDQNAADMMELWPLAPIGIYSAGLGIKNTTAPIIYGGVQSVVNNVQEFGHRDLMLVDECHLMSGKDDSMYGEVIAALRVINPYMKVIGFTATPYRTGQGLLTDGDNRIFTDIVYDMTTMRMFNLLIEQGFLCPLRPKQTAVEIDVSGVSTVGGEYKQSQLEEVADVHSITEAAVHETVQQGYTRRSWLLFAAGVKHAGHIADRLRAYGVPTGMVHGQLPRNERKQIIDDYKAFKLRAIVNYGVLTTGFNHPATDLISHLRPTKSTGLWVQTLGRGTRPCAGKEYGLVLDFAGNTKRLGPINDPVIPTKRGKGKDGVVPIKICPQCGFYNHTRATVCCNCPHIFPMEPKITASAATDELLRTENPQIELFDVAMTLYTHAHTKNSGNHVLVTYHCGAMGIQRFTERIFLESTNQAARGRARDWWRSRYLGDGTARMPESFAGWVPSSTAEALHFTSYLKQPRQIRVHVNRVHEGKLYPQVVGHTF